MTDGDALVRAILAAPADDAPRLVYADWLEERGRAEDAEFIRVQVELARLGFGGGLHTDELGRLRHAPPHVAELTTRQLELWYAGHARPDLPDEMATWPMTVHPTPGQNLLIRRGFVERVVAFSDVFLELAGGLFARQPVTHVRLVDLLPVPDQRSGKYIWDLRPSDRSVRPGYAFPVELAAHFPEACILEYTTADEADAALSWACVRYGRSLAGLEPVEPRRGGSAQRSAGAGGPRAPDEPEA